MSDANPIRIGTFTHLEPAVSPAPSITPVSVPVQRKTCVNEQRQNEGRNRTGEVLTISTGDAGPFYRWGN